MKYLQKKWEHEKKGNTMKTAERYLKDRWPSLRYNEKSISHFAECYARHVTEQQSKEIERLQEEKATLENGLGVVNGEFERRGESIKQKDQLLKEMAEVLERLVELKAYKMKYGKDIKYYNIQPKAWFDAKQTLSKYKELVK